MNKRVLESENQEKILLSTRLVEYMALYSLKKGQVEYFCPLNKNKCHDQGYEIEMQCLDQLNDVELIYEQERRKAFSKIREKEKAQEEKQKKNQNAGFSLINKFFGKKQQKPKKEEPKQTIENYLLKSSSFLKESQLPKSKMKNNVENEKQPFQSTKKKDKLIDWVFSQQKREEQIQNIYCDENEEKTTKKGQREKVKIEEKRESQEKQQEIDLDDLLSYHSTEKQMRAIIEQEEQEETDFIKLQKVQSFMKNQNKSESSNKLEKYIQNEKVQNFKEEKEEQSFVEFLNISQDLRKTEKQLLENDENGENMKGMLRLQALDMQQKIIVNKIISKWSKPIENLDKIIDEKWKSLTESIPKPKPSQSQRLVFSPAI